eukprot:933507-Pelagomonas_calceolata.AAC.1
MLTCAGISWLSTLCSGVLIALVETARPNTADLCSCAELDSSAVFQDRLDVLCEGLHMLRVGGINLEVSLRRELPISEMEEGLQTTTSEC